MIISQNSNDVYYAYTRGRFWRWDGSARVWKESHLLAQKFDKAKAAEKHLTPEAFLTGDEFIPMDDYELPQSMLTALRDAKPCQKCPHRPSGRGFFLGCSCSLHLLYLHLWRVQRRMLRKLPRLRQSRAGVQQLPDRGRKVFTSRSLCGCYRAGRQYPRRPRL